jgi:hypothetical protein
MRRAGKRCSVIAVHFTHIQRETAVRTGEVLWFPVLLLSASFSPVSSSAMSVRYSSARRVRRHDPAECLAMPQQNASREHGQAFTVAQHQLTIDDDPPYA